ncbi:MAG: UDP-N-acetylmuramate--L-alanine ligase, partial [Clostridia bacterium]|nr:UDP-N-acetylmuramate--L-alanine ligase [Clostridia bacterium]
DEIIESFRNYALLTQGNGCVIASGEDENIKKALSGTDLDIKYYGIGNGFEYHAENLIYKAGFPAFEIWHNDKLLCNVSLRVPGRHNVLNALAVSAVCDTWGLDPTLYSEGIAKFHGAKRRFEKKGEFGGATIMDDYAHHPTEIQATLKSAKEFPYNKLWCIFQPHTYTRTKSLWNEFCESFDHVDELIITDIYAAREKSDGVTKSENLAKDIAKRGVKVRYIPNFADIESVLKAEIQQNDLVFTMGAGNVVDIADNLCK